MSGTWKVLVKSSFFGDFNGHLGKCAEGFEGVHGRNGIGKRNAEGIRLLEFCDEKELKADKRKITCSTGGFEAGIDFVLVGKKYTVESI